MTAPAWFSRTLRVGDSGGDVKIVQRKLLDEITGTFSEENAARVRGLQLAKGLPVSGEVDEPTAEVLGESADAGQTPEWYERDLALWDEGADVKALREALGMNNGDDRFDPDVEAAVRRFQSENEIDPTGRVNHDLAVLISQKNPL